ncbi:uncharacterized protein BXZ73DRAFT_88961 [Epithele typhae]|uniref:uncharacterized protein n=1 Tax=Epithele typhae TaxID=378194 RepID=UPI002008B7C0|nr:uncharacterized protein BXZ73DRAFT_88961 [Epithele typhae]KAH9939238.1 hypothetical protein BXZ73DRAFT_88961 [Epithele typhae]
MVAREIQPQVIDLTAEPDVIDVDSDDNAIQEVTPNGTNHTKKKRKKRKRKVSRSDPSTADGQGDPSSAETSQPASRNTPPPSDLVINLVDDSPVASGSKPPPPPHLSLAERLTEPSGGKKKDVERDERRRERREEERRRNRDRDHYREDRTRDNERQSRRERERRRSRSPGHDHRGERRRSRSRERTKSKKRTKGSAADDKALFFEDLTPMDIPAAMRPPPPLAGPSSATQASSERAKASDNKKTDGLLLPGHVFVAPEGQDADLPPLKMPTPGGSDDEDGYIDYLEYDDDRKVGMIRYWELEKLEAQGARPSKPTRFVCKKCGDEGDHKAAECPHLICLTCGARDEHGTRSCPVSKVCFTCGMKGHINKNCPNRGRQGGYYSSHDCDRCGARTHQTNECPTLWRMYIYVEDDARQDILRIREDKRLLPLGEGGEGYIATDEWCYNCGGCGHLGDDCNDVQHPFDHPEEHSAFSIYNILSGPFSSEAPRQSKRAPRDWETVNAFSDGFGSNMPMQVGKQGRRKERERLARAREQQADDDDDDWFAGNRARPNNKGSRGSSRNKGDTRGGGGKIKFDFSTSSVGVDRGNKQQRTDGYELPAPMQETESLQIRGASRRDRRSSPPRDRDERYGRYDRERDRDRDRDWERRDPQKGPRYRGGYYR